MQKRCQYISVKPQALSNSARVFVHPFDMLSIKQSL